MLVGGSTVVLGLSAAGLAILGPGSTSMFGEGLMLLATVSTFLVICLTEARQAS